MATLEEIAQQFEDALTESTGTTITPGTITPQGVTSSVSGKKKLSWPEIVEKINEGVGVRQNELLPDVPKGVSAQKFYRTAAQSGLLPSGLSTFTSSPFGSFSKRTAIAQQAATQPDTSEPASALDPVVAPKSVIQTQKDTDDYSLSDEDSVYASPIANPDINLATFAKFMVSPGTTMMELHQSENVYTTLDGYTAAQIDDMVATGMLNDAQIAAYQQGITHMTNNGEPVDYRTGKAISIEEYDRLAAERDNNNILFRGINNILKSVGFDGMTPGGRNGFTPGYQQDGTYTTAGGQNVAMGTTASFQSLADVDPVAALDVINARGTGILGISAENVNYANQALGRMLDQEDRDFGPDYTGSAPGGPDISPQAGDADAPGEEDIDGIDGGDGGTSDDSGEDTLGDDGLGWGFQEGGQVAQGAEADMSNLGMINEQAAQPQQGGAVSVKDDIPREADEGDYILPYETVLLVGLKDLNRYAREAIDLAMKNGVNLKGTDLDPTDDVPIKVSNYEYHIPKMLVPFFGGGKKYLDKIRQEGLDLRKRLEEEKQPSMQEQQPMAEAQPAPAPAQAAPAPQVPMMQQGGFVDDPQKKQMQTSAAVLETDASQQAPSAYNQMQALERTRRQAQQPPMVDPMGRVVQQGFAAPQGYALGTEPGGVPMPEAEDQIYLDTPELKEPFSEKPDPFMQKRTESMATPEPYSDEGIGGDDETLGDIIGQPEKPMPTEDMARAKQAMQTLKNLPDLALMAIVAIGEARSQDREGMQAVMHVMKNRLKYPKRFGKNINEVITKKHQFSALLPDLDDPETYKGPRFENFKAMMKISYKDKIFQDTVKDAEKIMKGELPDTTKGSTHYYNFKTIKPPSWAKDMVENVKIKSHIFLGISGMQDGGFVARAA